MEQIAVWDDTRYSVGIEEIDNQHKELFRLVNELYKARNMSKDELKSFLPKFLKSISDYAIFHFESEERYMNAIRYNKTHHIKQHKDFVSTVFDVITTYNRTREFDVVGVSRFLYKWLIDHIGRIDKSFGKEYLVVTGQNS